MFSRNNHLHFFYFNIFYLRKSEIPIQEDIRWKWEKFFRILKDLQTIFLMGMEMNNKDFMCTCQSFIEINVYEI